MSCLKCTHLHMGLNRLLWSFGGIAEQGDLWEGPGAGGGRGIWFHFSSYYSQQDIKPVARAAFNGKSAQTGFRR